jgi:antitoxin component of MazEF toxin-antitoxin module
VIKKLSKHGNSLALVIDRPILELLKIDEETSLNVVTDGDALIVAPVRDEKRKKRLQEAITRGHKRYAKTFRRLAE